MSDWAEKYPTSFRGRLIHPSRLYVKKPAGSSIGGVLRALMSIKSKRRRQTLAGRFARALVDSGDSEDKAVRVCEGVPGYKRWEDYFPGLYWTVGEPDRYSVVDATDAKIVRARLNLGEEYMLVDGGDADVLRWAMWQEDDEDTERDANRGDGVYIEVKAPTPLYRILRMFASCG